MCDRAGPGQANSLHWWADPLIPAEPAVDYYYDVVSVTYDGNRFNAEESVRLFMAPGMFHCRGGPGPSDWDKLGPLAAWVENGHAPDSLVVTHSQNGRVDNERILCPYPKRSRYTGGGDANDPSNWVASNFTCTDP